MATPGQRILLVRRSLSAPVRHCLAFNRLRLSSVLNVLLDTNVWRYIVDCNAQAALTRAARSARVQILVAPAVAYECMHILDRDLRSRVVELITRTCWRRAMPEAFSECEELKSEIRALRPEWVRDVQDLEIYKRLRFDWKRREGGFWTRARQSLERESENVRVLQAETMERARKSAYAAREDLLRQSFSTAKLPLQSMLGAPRESIPGWEGKPVEYWRMPALISTQTVLRDPDPAYSQWLSGDNNIDFMLSDPESFNRFWLYDVRTSALPRFWLRAAFELLQGEHRVTDGTPGDAQLATYLVDADVVVSADKNFIRFVERCRDEGPFRIAEPVKVAGGTEGVRELLELMEKRFRRCDPETTDGHESS